MQRKLSHRDEKIVLEIIGAYKDITTKFPALIKNIQELLWISERVKIPTVDNKSKNDTTFLLSSALIRTKLCSSIIILDSETFLENLIK